MTEKDQEDIDIICRAVGLNKVKMASTNDEIRKYLPNLFKIAEDIRENERQKTIKIINKLIRESIKCGEEHDCSQEVELQCYWEDSGAIGILKRLKRRIIKS